MQWRIPLSINSLSRARFEALHCGVVADTRCVRVHFDVVSDDSTVRLWDLRTSKGVRCIARVFDGQAVTSVTWHRSAVIDDGEPHCHLLSRVRIAYAAFL